MSTLQNEFDESFKEKTKRVIKSSNSGALESQECDSFKQMLSTHYNWNPVVGSSIHIERKNIEIYGKAACIACQILLGDPEKFANLSFNHK